MSNSSLVNYTKISPNKNSPRNSAIKKITIHHMAGNMTIENCGTMFARPERRASSNYAIGSDGRVAMYVEEKDRSWCSGNGDNDHQAVTIEVANDGGAPDWHVSDKALAKLIDLCTDICKRNGINRLNFTGDKTGNLTMHKYFQATACPGPYLASKFPYIASEVNKRLTGSTETEPESSGFFPTKGYFSRGDKHENVAKIASFMRRVFPAYTSEKALGDLYGPYIQASIKEFQKRTGLETDGNTGPITLSMLKKYGFKE